MARKIFFAALALLLVSAVSCGAKKLPVRTLAIRTASGQTVTVRAEIARTAEERSRGFMERTRIPDGTGMLFVFEKDQILSFWMKDTPTPLSIAFIDSAGTIRNIFDMKPYSLANTVSTVSVRYALEVPQGWFVRAGIAHGDTLVLEE